MMSLNSRTSLTQLARNIARSVAVAVAAFAVAALALAPSANAAPGVCDTAGPIEVESDLPSGPTAYATVQLAFDAINTGAHQGSITIDVCGDTTETVSAVLNASGGPSSYGTIAMSPVGGPWTISGSIAGALVDLNGADSVTINGLNALTIENTSATATASTIRFIADASSNTVQSCTIKGAETGTASGTIAFATGTATGNVSNIISANTITSSGATLPANAIYSAGTSAVIANTASITNNFIQDYFSGTVASNGIQVASNSTAWTITGNRFFQSATRTATVANTHRAINIITASGNSYTINSNIIGYATSGGTGTTTYTGAVASTFVGIALTAANTPASTIGSNEIASIQVTSTAAATGGTLNGIVTSSPGSYTISSNTVGSTTTADSIQVGTSGLTTAVTTFIGISNGGTGTISITGNTIQNCSAYGTGASIFTGITNTGGTGTLTITTNNLISGRNAGTGAFTGISSTAGAATANINNNVIRSNTKTAASGGFTGIANTGAVTTALNINSNQLGNGAGGLINFTVVNSSALTGITSTGTTTAALSISSNDFQGITYGGLGSGAHTYITYSNATSAAANINSNTFTNLNVNTTGSITFITRAGSMTATGSENVNSNAIVTAFNKGGSPGTITFFGANASSVNGSTMTNNLNNFSNITLTGATVVAGWSNTEGASVTNGPTKTITNNTFNNIVVSAPTSASNFTGITASFSGANSSVSNNTVSNVTVGGTTIGISLGSSNQATLTCSQNIVDPISSTLGAVTGIANTSPNAVTITRNTVFSLSSGAAAAVNGISTSSTTAGTALISRNKIYDLSGSNAASTVNGILVSGGTTVQVQNNLIGDLRADVATSAVAPFEEVRGISITSATALSTVSVFYNSINLNALLGGTNFGSAGVFHTASATATTAALNLRNNVIVNTSVPRGTGATVAYRRSSGAVNTLNNYAASSNNNDFYAGTPGAANLIYADGTSSAQTIAAYKNGIFTAGTINPRDYASFTENPPFLSTTGSSANFLHINGGIGTQLESAATSIAGVLDDYDGDARAGTTPDVGADEFTGTVLDQTGPSISYSLLSRGAAAATRAFGPVTIVDATGVEATAGIRPRVYYKKSTDATNAFNDNTSGTAGWKYAEATGGGGSPFSFVIDYSLLFGGGGAVAGDTIQYFVAAQDTVTPTPNVSINSGILAATPTSVALTGAFPITGTINSYAVVAPLSGTYTVCAGGCSYTSLTNAGGVFADINAKVISSNLRIEIAGDLTGETGANALAVPVEDPVGNYTITILPTGVARSVTGTGTGGTLITLLGADRVTIDGSIGGGGSDRSLSLTNGNAATGTGTVFLGSLGVGAGSTNVTIKNCIISAGGIGTTAVFTFGVFVGDSTGAAAGADNDNFTFQNNQIRRARTGMQMVGTAAGVDDNASITGNLFGDNTLANSIGRVGLLLSTANNATVSGNTVKNVFLGAPDTANPIAVSLAGLTGSTISQNTITNVQLTGSSVVSAGLALGTSSNTVISQNSISQILGNAATDIPTGLNLGSSTGITIDRNTIDGVINSVSGDPIGIVIGTGFVSSSLTANTITNINVTPRPGGGYGGRGIDINTGSAASALTIANNSISNIQGDGWNSFASDSIAGIKIMGITGGLNIYFNSVNLGSGSFVGNTSGTLSAAMYIASTASALNIRDNVFATNLLNSGAGAAKSYAIYSDAPASAFTDINNNDYFGSGAQGILGFFAGSVPTDRTTIALWQASTGKDAASINADPLFNTATNLQPQLGSPLIGAGAPAGGIGTDIVGTPRNGSTPSIGAYELAVDTSAPAISYAALANTISTASPRPLTPVTVTDSTGVNIAPGTRPRIYYKKSTDANDLTGWKFTEATGGGGSPFSFDIDYTLLNAGSVVIGDTIQYFVVAQDTASPINVGINSGAFSAPPTSVALTSAAFPINPTINQYSIVGTISGTKTVCASGCDYTTLTGATGAFADINGKVATGNIEIQITGDLIVGEDGSVGLKPLAEEPPNSNYTVKIYPNVAPAVLSAVAITGSSATSLIRLEAADRVTIDGSNGGTGSDRTLTITNTNTATSSAVVWMQSNGADGATNNTVKNVNVVGSNTFAGAANGTLIGVGSGSSTVSISSTGTGNNANTVQNCNISKSQYGIFAGGASAANKGTGNVITQNAINTASPNGITTGGILAIFQDGIQVTRNTVGNILKHDGTTGTTTTAFGIALGVVPNNTVTSFTGSEVTNATVTRNSVNGVVQLHATGYSAFGIVVNSVTSGTTLLANNMVAGVRAASTASDFSAGIIAGGGTGSTTQIYFNSVSMTGSRNAATFPSYGLAIGSGDPIIDVRDNIFSNTQSSSSTAKMYAIGAASSTYANTVSDINDLYVNGTGTFVGQTGGLGTAGSDQAGLINWQGATGKDAGSFSVDPQFVSATDLHLDTSGAASAIENAGAFLAAVPNDIDGDLRHTTTPDIGADEVRCHAVIPAEACIDGNPCTTDACIPATGCSNPAGNAGAICLPGTGICDPDDLCDGTTTGCPATFAPEFTACGDPDATDCNAADSCNATGTCLDRLQSSSFVCRSSTDTCDATEFCTGGSAICPADVFEPSSTVCRPAANACDTAESCTGSGPACPADVTGGPVNVTATGGTPGPTAYANLGAAFAAINAGTHQTAVTVEICASVNEGATPATLNSSGAGAALYTSVLVRPVAPLITVSGAPAGGFGVVQLNGADGVTIDGDDPNTVGTNRDLTIANTAAATTTFNSVVRVALSTLVSTANGDTVKNCILTGSAIGRNATGITSTTGSENTTYGILVGGGASTVAATTAPSAITSVTTVVGSPITATGFTADNNAIDAVARGIAVQGSATTVATGLTITNNVIGNGVPGSSTTVYARGITIQGFDGPSVKGNLIRNMAYFVGTAQMGIAMGADGSATGTNAVIDSNVVDGVNNRSLSTFGAYGINVAAGNNNTVKNNFVTGVTGDVSGGAAFSTTFGLFGIRVASGTGHKVYHNSVNMFGLRTGTPTATSLLSASFGITVTGLTGTDVRNNIFANTQSGGTSTLAYVSVFLPASGTTANMNLTWNNNAYFTGSAAASGVAHVGTTFTAVPAGPPTYAGLYTAANFSPGATSPNSNFRAYTTTLSAANTNDTASFATTAAAPFTSSSNLHINTGLTPTVLESGGASVGVVVDIDGDTRPGPTGSVNGGATAADTGADEFDGVPLAPNDIQATAFIDPTNGGTKPAGGLFSPQASFTNNGTAAQTNVTVRYRILDIASFEVYNDAQVIASITPFATTTVTFTATSLPAGTYTIKARSELVGDQSPGNDEITGTLNVETPLCGNYNVGSGGDFASLTNTGGAFEKLNGVGASCNVTFSVVSDLAGETGTVAQNQWLEAGAGGYTLTIRPSGGPRQIVGSNLGGLVRLNGADRVTIEGSTTGATATGVGGSSAIRELTIQNTNTGTSAVVISVGSGANGAQNNTIRNVIVLGQDPTTTIIAISLGGNTPGTAGTDNDNNHVENCFVGRSIYGIYAVGASAANQNSGTVITMNETSAVTADRVRRVGMLLFNDDGAQVTLNSINGVSTTEAADGIGIGLGTQAIDTTSVVSGAITNAFVSRNRINGVASLSTTGFSAAGITLSGATGGANTVVNNMITGVTAPATSPDIVAGIYVIGAVGSSTRLYDNSVSLTGDRGISTSTAQLPSFGLAVTGTNPTLELKNNIFYTTQTASGGVVGSKSYAIGMVTTTFTNLDSNFNDFWSTGVNDGGFRSGSLAAAAGTDYATLGLWSIAVSDDTGSFEVNPVFVSPINNLHLDTSGPATAIENAGLVLAAVPVDFDGDLRNPSTPDIGADEVRCHAAIPAETCSDANPCTVDSCDPATGCQPSVPGNLGAVCRPAATACDALETCDGASAACPADGVAPFGTLCLTGTGTCDPDDTCNGTDTVCAPVFASNSTTCGDAEGVCTNQDFCNGSGSCADNGFKPLGTVCLSGTGTCDPNDTCNGTDGACAPFYAPSSTLCVGGTSTGNECDDDAADHCSGISAACVDGFQPDTVSCTGTSNGGICDGDDHCSGTSSACADGYQPSSYECRASTVPCDPAEFCTGSGGSCPADLVNQSPAVGSTVALTHNKVSGNTTISWMEVEPGPFDVYRGAIRPGVTFTYNQTCFDLNIPGPSTDSLQPAPGWVFFYLVSRVESPCPESSLGQDSAGAERPNTLACPTAPPDTDGDGFQNNLDNCPTNYNPSQNDVDVDGVGDACDNCVSVPNPDQGNVDNDAYGDACDFELDGDGVVNEMDNCVFIANPDQADSNRNGIGDVCEPWRYKKLP